MEARVDLECDVVRRDISLREIVELKAGDIVPISLPDYQVVTANGVPMFKANIGQCNGNLALRLMDFVDHSNVRVDSDTSEHL